MKVNSVLKREKKRAFQIYQTLNFSSFQAFQAFQAKKHIVMCYKVKSFLKTCIARNEFKKCDASNKFALVRETALKQIYFFAYFTKYVESGLQ